MAVSIDAQAAINEIEKSLESQSGAGDFVDEFRYGSQDTQQNVANQVLRGALKWGGPIHPVPDKLLASSSSVPVTVSGSTMPVWKGLETPFDPTRPFTGKAVWTSPTKEVAKIFAGPDTWHQGNPLWSPWKPETGTVIKGSLPTDEWVKGLHVDRVNQAHQILLDSENANKVFAQGSTTAKSIHTPRINRFRLPFDPETAKFPVSTKVLSRAARLAPGASIALGAYDTQRRFREGDYFGAGLGAISMVPGPIGWAGLGGQSLYDLSRWYFGG